MKQLFILAILCALPNFSIASEANDVSFIGANISAINIDKNRNNMDVSMMFDVTGMKVRSNKAVLLTPYLINGRDSLALTAIGLYGRTRYIQYLRSGEMLTGENDSTYRKSKAPNPIDYVTSTPYQSWMDGATLGLCYQLYGCCGNQLDDQDAMLAVWNVPFVPVFVYVIPPADAPDEVINKTYEGKAYVDFPVNKTTIYPDYRNNPTELAKIRASIDQVKDNNDCVIDSMFLKGYASPESSWANNTRLAKGRTEAIKNYIQSLYNFDYNLISTDFEPEDWEGLRRFVDSSNLEHREQILALIDGTLNPDSKEAKIKALYPNEYRYLLNNCYPALRHTDYKIKYIQHIVSNHNDAARVIGGLHMLAQTFDKNSKDYKDIYETAVRMYPDEPAANINAANAAMERKDMSRARELLSNAGDSPEASYACGLYAYLEEDYDSAIPLLKEAAKGGVEEAQLLLDWIEKQYQ